MSTDVLQDLFIAVGLLGLLLSVLELGFQAGKRRSREEGDQRAAGQIGAIQGAVLGLLGLLLGFSFAAAGSRFLERQDLIVREANAIGTAYLRADLLDEPHKDGLRSALSRYTRKRIDVSSQLRGGLPAGAAEEFNAMHREIWAAARSGVEAKPQTMLGVLPPVNDVIDIHSLRLASGKKHLPLLVMGLLIGSSVMAVGMIGFGCGTTGRRRPALTLPLAVLIGTSLWITIDLDHPRAGLLRLSDEPLRALRLD